MKTLPRSRTDRLAALVVSLWSFVILPVAPAYASLLQPQANVLTDTDALLSSSDPTKATPVSDTNDELASTIAGYAQSAGSMFAGGNSSTNMSTVAGERLLNTASGTASAEVERWLSGFGTARVRVDIDREFTLKNSEAALLVPWYQRSDLVVFSQQGIHRTDDRTQVNFGAGIRHFGSAWMTGVNTFYDHDLTRYHSRAGIGAELWRDYLKLGTNGYLRLSNWRSAPELNNDYEARPANGWDIRAEGWLPAYPQLGARMSMEQYYGKEVALFGRNSRQANPYAITAGLNWTPVPLVTVSAEHRAGKGGENDARFGLQLNWTPGISWPQHLDPEGVRERRTLAGSRLDLVERNNSIVLEYRKKELIKLALRERTEGTPGQVFSLVTLLQTKYPLQAIDWQAGEFLAAGGSITGAGTGTRVTLPAYRSGENTEEAQRLNSYTVSAVARDSHGNVSSRAQGILVVQDTGAQQQVVLTASPQTIVADNTEASTLTLTLKDQNGAPQPGKTVAFLVNGVTGTTLGGVIDHGDGSYTTTLRGSAVGTATVTATVDGTAEPGAAAIVTLTQVKALFTLTANTHIVPYTFAAGSGFPTTGFVGATFTVTGLAAGTTASDYTWAVQTPGGGNVSWLSVDQGGVVTFSQPPSPADKSVEIIATPRTGGGRMLGYQFTLQGWFIQLPSTLNFTTEDVTAFAAALCRGARSDRLATVKELISISTLVGHGGNYTHGTLVSSARGKIGGLFTEWSAPRLYPNSNFYSANGYWTSDYDPYPYYPQINRRYMVRGYKFTSHIDRGIRYNGLVCRRSL